MVLWLLASLPAPKTTGIAAPSGLSGCPPESYLLRRLFYFVVSLLFQGLDSELLFIYGLGHPGARGLSGVGARGLLSVCGSFSL